MAGEGSAFAAISVMRSNRALLKKKSYFDTKSIYLNFAERKNIKDPKSLTKDQLSVLRVQFIADRKAQIIKKALSGILALIFSVGLIYGMIYWIKEVFQY